LSLALRQVDETDEVAELLLPPDVEPASVRPLAGGRTFALRGETMGTGWSLSVVAPVDVPAERLRLALEAAFGTVIAQMSQWEPDSEISRFNRAEPGSRHALSPQFRIVLDHALKIARLSDGAFDPALGAASEAWGFGSAPAPQLIPADEPRAHDWRAIELTHDGTLLQPGALQLDLSGIAKGFAVDMGLAVLQRHGIAHALLEVGGELAAIGVQADGMPWWVDIETPPSSQAPAARVGLTGWALATSGSYIRRRSAAGESWSHTLDPQTGRPLGDQLLSVTVLDKLCMDADALATAITVLGAEAGMAFADRHGIPARMVTRTATLTSAPWRLWLD